MKKVFLSLLLVLGGTIWANAQKEYNGVTLAFSTGKWEDAKKEIDKLATDPKSQDKAQTYLWKLNVYAELYADSSLRSKYPGAEVEAKAALDKYVEKEPDLKTLKENSMRSVSLLYGSSFNDGKAEFEKKDWNAAYTKFAFCQQMSEFVGKNGLSSSGKYTIDTVVVLFTAYAAQNAGKNAEAAARYKALADWKINDKEYVDIYKFILDYDTKQKDEASFKKYLALAKELYPAEVPVWNQFEMQYMSTNSSLADIMKRYKEEEAGGKLTEDAYVTYAENFAAPDKAQLDQLDSTQQVELKMTAADAFAKAYNLNNTKGLYAFNTGVLYYSLFTALDDRFYNNAGESAALKAKRAEIVKQQQEIGAKAIEWLEKGYTTLKAKEPREKSEATSLNRSVDYLANLYMWKRDKSRGVNPKDYDAFDAKYQAFDAEHDKYKP